MSERGSALPFVNQVAVVQCEFISSEECTEDSRHIGGNRCGAAVWVLDRRGRSSDGLRQKGTSAVGAGSSRRTAESRGMTRTFPARLESRGCGSPGWSSAHSHPPGWVRVGTSTIVQIADRILKKTLSPAPVCKLAAVQ
ncbi:uncharacterized protein M8220_017938 isoform 1-T1 [Acridotheres tristis]